MPRTYLRLSDRHPFEVYLLALALFTSVLGAAGITPPPASVRVALNPIAGRVWALALAIGCVVALVGIAWHRPKVGLTVTGLILEQVGLFIVSAATIYYCCIAFYVTGGTRAVLAFIATCVGCGLYRALDDWRLRVADVAAVVACCVVLVSAGGSANIAVGTVLAFGAASLAQAWKIRRLLKILEQEAKA